MIRENSVESSRHQRPETAPRAGITKLVDDCVQASRLAREGRQSHAVTFLPFATVCPLDTLSEDVYDNRGLLSTDDRVRGLSHQPACLGKHKRFVKSKDSEYDQNIIHPGGQEKEGTSQVTIKILPEFHHFEIDPDNEF